MNPLAEFPITARWPARHPDRLQLYSLNTPNGVKVSIMLEETGLRYEPHVVDIGNNETYTPEFLSLNPNGKIPAIIDPEGPVGKPLGLFESGAILLYLADKTGKFIPSDPALRWKTIQWVFFQMAAIGPMFGQGYFNRFAGKEIEDKRPLQRYVQESRRLLGVLETRLDRREWMLGDHYTIADISMLGWVRNLVTFYDARELVEFDSLRHVPAAGARACSTGSPTRTGNPQARLKGRAAIIGDGALAGAIHLRQTLSGATQCAQVRAMRRLAARAKLLHKVVATWPSPTSACVVGGEWAPEGLPS